MLSKISTISSLNILPRLIIPSESKNDKIEFGLEEISLNVGDSYNLSSILLYSNSNDVTLSSSDENKVKVSGTTITVAASSTEVITITATNSNGKTAKIKVNIN